MNQYITLDQLKEIDSQIIAEKVIRPGYIKHPVDKLIRVKSFANKITIGKMLEILNKVEEVSVYSMGSTWHVEIAGAEYVQHDLCDALWEAMKKHLAE